MGSKPARRHTAVVLNHAAGQQAGREQGRKALEYVPEGEGGSEGRAEAECSQNAAQSARARRHERSAEEWQKAPAAEIAKENSTPLKSQTMPAAPSVHVANSTKRRRPSARASNRPPASSGQKAALWKW